MITSGVGALAAGTFLVLYSVFDRPRYKDRYAGLVLGLGIISFLGFAVPFLLSLSVDLDPPEMLWRWAISIVIRGLASVFMCWLLWVYLTPNRAKLRLGRFVPGGRESGE